MVRVSDSDVYRTLRISVWKTTLEIKHELQREFFGDRIPFLDDISTGSIYAHLENLVDRGYSQKRIREPKPGSAGSKRKPNEYALMQDGLRAYDQYIQKAQPDVAGEPEFA